MFVFKGSQANSSGRRRRPWEVSLCGTIGYHCGVLLRITSG